MLTDWQSPLITLPPRQTTDIQRKNDLERQLRQLISVNIPAFKVAAPYTDCQGFRSLESADYRCLGDAKSGNIDTDNAP